MKKLKQYVFALVCILLISACSTNETSSNHSIEVTDANQNQVKLEKSPEKVVILSSSWVDLWQLAGGKVYGATSDVEERDLNLADDVKIVGSIKDPNTEEILALEPDFVVLSKDLSSHVAIAKSLNDANIPNYITKVETFDEYMKVLKDFTTITNQDSNYIKYGEDVKGDIDALLEKVPKDDKNQSALFLRAFSTGVKAKADEHVVCDILEAIGIKNIAQKDGFPLDDISIEAIMEEDPDYIFISSMGSEKLAKKAVKKYLESDPAWKTLSAVKNDNVIFLEKDLYQYKPNAKWADAYETILKIVYPDAYKK